MVDLYSGVYKEIMGLSELGMDRLKTVDNMLADMDKAGKAVRVFDTLPIDKIAELTPEQVTGSVIPEMMWENMYTLKGLGDLGKATAKSFKEASRLIQMNRNLAVVGVIGVGCLGYYVYTKFKEQETKINNLNEAVKNLNEANTLLVKVMEETARKV